jgi:hypothetical protein
MTDSTVRLKVEAAGARSELKKTAVETKKLENAVKGTNARLGTATKRLDHTGKAAATATGNIQRFGVAFRTTLAPIVAATGAVTLLSRSLNLLGQRQADTAALSNGLQKLGEGEQTLNRLQASADALGKTTLFDQEDFDRGFALLTSFQRIGVDSYERVAKAAADVAQITGQDVRSALLQLSKALEDPARRVTDLSRSGTVFTEQQKEQIKALQESGRLIEAQNLVLSEIEKQYGGAAEAAGKAGYAGAVDSLGESFRDFQERLAQGVEPAVIGATKALTDLFDIIGKIPKPVGQAALGIGATATAIIALKAAAAAAIPIVKSLFALVVANPFVALAAGITAATVALAGYRNESEQIADAAVGGGAAEIQAARAKLIETEMEISLKKLELKDADGRAAQNIKRELQRLRKNAQTLRKSIPRAQDLKPPGSGDGDDTEPVKDMSRRLLNLNKQLRAAQEAEQQRLAATLKLMVEKQKISESTLGPIAKEDKLQQAIHNFRQEIFKIDQKIADQREKDLEKAAEGFEAQMAHQDELKRAIAEQKSQYEELNNTFRNGIVNSILDAVEGTRSLSESLAGILRQMARMILQQQLMNALSGFNPFKAAPSTAGPGGYTIPSGAIPKFANGGRPPVNRPSVVGERGPELFVPDRAGTIVPNNALGGANVVVNVDASGTQAQGDQPNAKALGAAIGAAVQAELVKQKRPGGLLS